MWIGSWSGGWGGWAGFAGWPVFGVLVAHMESEPGVREYARSKGVAVYLSYEFDA
ncbi:hypothetical protein [Limisphaera sp. VF-2]|uniref:hypothetical protein n=1 Tax=Limisphaera sp. VF-2 TaxID=3400418 RepID=UPI003C1A0D4A